MRDDIAVGYDGRMAEARDTTLPGGALFRIVEAVVLKFLDAFEGADGEARVGQAAIRRLGEPGAAELVADVQQLVGIEIVAVGIADAVGTGPLHHLDGFLRSVGWDDEAVDLGVALEPGERGGLPQAPEIGFVIRRARDGLREGRRAGKQRDEC